MIFIFLGFIFMVISILLFIFASHIPADSGNDIVINKNVDNGGKRTIVVDVCGAVIRPDMYEVTAGARLKQLINLAGGLSDNAHREYFSRNFNLARIITDQEKIYVPSITEVSNNIIVENQRTLDYASPSTGDVNIAPTTDTPINNQLININSATLEELDTLPGIGQVTAQKIIQNRPYKSIDELVSKKAVNKNVFENIKGLISM